MIKLLVIGLLFIVFLLRTTNYELPTAKALESSPSADVKQKLEQLKKDIASKAAQIKKQISEKLQNKAYVGKVTLKNSSSLTLATRSGARIVNINQDTVYERRVKSKTKFSQTSLKDEDLIVALGDIDEAEVLTAKKIILLPQSTLTVKTSSWGQILSLSDSIITIKNKEIKNVAITTSEETDIPTKLKVGDFVIVSGVLNKEGILEATFVYSIPPKGSVKLASPSAKVATPFPQKR